MRYCILIVSFLLFVGKANGQYELGNIKVNINQHSTLILPDNILPNGDILIPNNPPVHTDPQTGISVFKYFDVSINRNMVVIRSRKAINEIRTITIMLNNGAVYTGTLSYDENPDTLVYNYTDNKVEHVNGTSTGKVETEDTELKERLQWVINQESQYNSLGIVSNYISFKVGNIYKDNKHTYFKLEIKNNTASDYIIDLVKFRYDDNMKRKINADQVQNEERKFTELELAPQKVSAYSAVAIGYVIPIFTNTKRGKLHITLIEKNGNRESEIVIDSKVLANVPVFEADIN